MGLLDTKIRSFLPDRDYVPLAMPTTGVDVLGTLIKDGGVLRKYGMLADLLAGPSLAAQRGLITRSRPTTNTMNVSTRETKGKVSIATANAALAALGGKADLDISKAGVRNAEVRYTDMVIDNINTAELDKWLDQANFSPATTRQAQMLVSQKLYIIVAVLKATGVAIIAHDSSDTDLRGSVAALQNTVGGNLVATSSSTHRNEVTFQGAKALTVAVKAARLKIDSQGFWINTKPSAAQEVRGSQDTLEYLSAESSLLLSD